MKNSADLRGRYPPWPSASVRASGRSSKKMSNFVGFSGTNLRKKTADFAGISRKFLRPISLKNDW